MKNINKIPVKLDKWYPCSDSKTFTGSSPSFNLNKKYIELFFMYLNDVSYNLGLNQHKIKNKGKSCA